MVTRIMTNIGAKAREVGVLVLETLGAKPKTALETHAPTTSTAFTAAVCTWPTTLH